MRFRAVAALAASSALLVACPGPSNQVEHTAQYETAPDADCVWQHLIDTLPSAKVQTIRDEITMGVAYRFNFDAGDASHGIGIVVLEDGGGIYRNTAWGLDMDAQSLRAAQRSALAIDASLAGHCGLGDLPVLVVKACYSKHCDALSAD